MNYWKEFLPFYVYTSLATTLAVKASYSINYSLSNILLLVMIGIISWMFVEYALHRFFFHYEAKSPAGKALIYRMHLSHHENPKALGSLFASLYTSIPLASLYCLLIWTITKSWQMMSYIFVGLIIGYFAYELLHYQAHHYTPKSSLLKYLKKYHMLHHHLSAKLCFGVTTPFIDWLFGTYKKT